MSITSSEMIHSSSLQSAPIFSGRTPLPPGINKSYKLVHIRKRDGREYDRLAATPELEQFKQNAEHDLLLAHCNVPVVEAIRKSYEQKDYVPLSVAIRFFHRSLWQCDIDGGIKAVMDAAFDIMALDDVLVARLEVTKELVRCDPHAEIIVSCVLSPSEK